MPCVGGPSEDYDYVDEVQKRLLNQKKHIDKLTRNLCTAMKILETRKIAVPEPLHSWWEKHKEFDKKRLKKERREKQIKAKKIEERKKALQNRKSGLNKLNEEEKIALGLLEKR